jgi:hypothetical protein
MTRGVARPEGEDMRKIMLGAAVAVVAATSSAVMAQQKPNPNAATYITAEQVETVNKQPGTDRTLHVVDLGYEHFSVGVIHRPAPAARGAAAGGAARGGGAAAGGRGGAAAGGGRGAAAAGGGAARAGGAARGGGAAAGGGAARGAAAAAEPCGQQMATPPASGGIPGMIAHNLQTESYYMLEGSGTLNTGGQIVNGRLSGPTASVTTELNGPSCSGTAYGSDIVSKVVKKGDIIIIPEGVPHGWTNITEDVTYLSFRPSQSALTPGYVHPSIK